jgi:hypothetical protein
LGKIDTYLIWPYDGNTNGSPIYFALANFLHLRIVAPS